MTLGNRRKSQARTKAPQREPKTSSERIKRKIDQVAGKDIPKDIRWWLHDEPHRAVFADGERIARMTRARRMQDFYLACLYDDDEMAGLIPGSGTAGEYVPQTMSSNIIKRQADAFVTKQAKNRPVPMGLTTGGNYGAQRRAKALSKFGQGMLDKVEYWETREKRLLDGFLLGSGFAYNYRVRRKFFHDRVFPWELEVDPREAQYGRPKTLRFRRYIDRLELLERFPEYEEEILSAASKDDNDHFEVGWDETCDLVLVRGVWHLRSGENADDGAFALCISNATLGGVKEYKRDYFPFSKFDFLGALRGWRGQSGAKSLVGLQYEVNAIGMRLQESGYMTGNYCLVEDGSGVEVDTLDNGISVVRYRGTKPEWVTPQPWHPAFFDYYLTLRGRFPAEETRMSEQMTRGEAPPQLKSGRAINAWHQLDDEAHVPAGRADERDVIDTMWQFFDLAEEIYDESTSESATDEQKKPYEVQVESRAHGRTVLEKYDYAKVRLDREKFVLRVFPTSFLSGTPEEVMDRVQDMINSGFLSQDEAMMLLDFPDLQRVMNLRTAARRNIERLLEKIKDADDPEGAYEYPMPAWNLTLCKALALMGWLEAKLDGVEEKNLRWMMQFALDAQAEIDKGNPANGEVDGQGNPIEAQDEQPPVDPNGAQYAPPTQPILPENAVAPTAIPNQPQV